MKGNSVEPAPEPASSLQASVSPAPRRLSGRRIRVVHLLHTMAYGGPETIILNWLRALPANRFECIVVCFANPGGTEQPFIEAASRSGLQVRLIPWARRKPFIRAARSLSAILREFNADILHCYNTYADIVGVVTKWMTGTPIITTLWVWGALGWKRRGLQLAERCVLPLFDRVTAQSESARRDTAQPGVPLEKVRLLICGFTERCIVLNPAERGAGRAQLGATPADFVMAHLARFWPEKAHDVLVEAFAILHNRNPHTKLWLAGVGPEEPKIRKLVTERGLDSSVCFLGFRSDLPELLALADMQVHPSHAEGVPLALCSGMAAGLPVVATSVGGVPEIIRNERTGILVPPGSPPVLAEAILKLIDDPARCRELGLNAQRFLRNEYSLEKAAADLESIYSGMVA